MPTTLNVTRTTLGFAPGGDLDGDGQYDPGDIIMIRIRVANTGAEDAANVSVTDTVGDGGASGITLVGGTTTVSPIPFNDAYALTGNTPITISAAAGLLANDSDPDGPEASLIVTGVDTTGTQGTVSFNPDGSFTFTPTTDFEGTTTFTYTAQDAQGLTNPIGGTVTMTVGGVNGMVWYVNSAAAPGGDGSYNNPYQSLAPLNGADLDDVGETIFVYESGSAYTGGITLEASQTLRTEGGPAFVVNGITITAGGGTNATIDNSATGITLSTDNTIRGVTVNSTTAGSIGIADGGGTVGNLVISNSSLTGVGAAFDVDQGGALNVALDTVSSSGATSGSAVQLAGGLTGSFTATGGTLAGTTGALFFIGNGSVDNGGTIAVTYGGDINASGNTAIRVSGRDASAGTVTFSGAVTHSGVSDAIVIDNHEAGIVNLTGNKTLAVTGANDALDISNVSGGTINFTTGTADIDTANGHGVNLVNITGGTINLSASGVAGLDIDASGTGRGISVTGNGAGSSGAAATVNLTGDVSITTADGTGLLASITAGQFLNLSSPELGTKSITTGVGGTAAAAGSGGALVSLTNVQLGTLFDFDGLTATESTNGNAIEMVNVDNNIFEGGTVTIAGATGDGINIGGGSGAGFGFGATNIGSSTNVAGDGVQINGTVGPVNFLSLDTSNVTGRGVLIQNTLGDVNIGTAGFGLSGTIDGTGQEAVRIEGGGVGTFTVNVGANVAKTNAGGNVIFVDDRDTSSTTLFTGNVTASGGSGGIRVEDSSSTAIDFSGQTISLSTGTGNAIDLVNNTGGTIGFGPAVGGNGLDITTSTGTGFNATGGGTVTVLQNGTTGAGTNTITSAGGPAVNISGTNIGGSDVTFMTINATGGANGIVLSNTGTGGGNGGLVITGDTGNAGRQGGTITNTTGDLVLLTNTRDVSFTEVNLVGGNGHAVNGTGVVNFTFANGFVDDPGDGDNDNGIYFGTPGATNITGTLNFTGSTIEDFQDHGLYVTNQSGTLVINVTDVIFQNNSAVNGEEGIFVDASGTSNTTLNVTGTPTGAVTSAGYTSTTRFINLEGGAINPIAQGNGVLDINITSILSTGTGGADNFPTPPSLTVTSDGSASTIRFDIINSRFADNSGDGIFIGGEGTLEGRITGNAIVDMLTGDGIRIDTDAVGTATATILIQNNTIDNVQDDGIQVLHRDGNKTLNLTITGNTISDVVSEGVRIFVDEDVAAGGPTALVSITNNTFSNVGTNGFDAGIDIRSQDAGTVVNAEITGNTGLPAARGIWLTSSNTASLTIEQASEAALEAANGGVVVDLFPSGGGTITFGVAVNVPLPTNPLFADPNPPEEPPPADEDPTDPPADEDPSDPPADEDPADPPADEDPSDPPVDEDPADPPAPPAHPVIVDDDILTQAELDYFKDAAIARWADVGASEAQLAAMRATIVTVADMMGLYLGKSAPGSILIDSDAAGYGWFLDGTPSDNDEFVAIGERLYARAGGDASGHMDLLTVLMHELGHQIGLEDSYKAADVDELMYGYAAVGQRKEPEADDLEGADPDHEAHEAYALPAVSIGTLPVGQTVDVFFEATINSQTNGLIVNPDNTATVTLSNGVAPSYTSNEVNTLDTLTLGGIIWLDMGAGGGIANDGIRQGGETVLDGVSVTLFADTGGSVGIWDAGDTQVGVSQLTAGGGYFSFTGLAPGEYIVRVDQDNFDAGGNTSLVASPISSLPNATDPDDGDPDTDDDDNGVQAAAGLVTYSLAITLAYNSEPTAGTGNDTNNTLDFGFVSNLPPTLALTPAVPTYNEPAGPNSTGAGVLVLTDATITDTDDTNIESATISVVDFVAGDVLSIDPGDLPLGIAANYVPGTGVLTLTGSATLADYELALEAVRYSHTGDNPDVFGTDGTRTISFVVDDGIAASTAQNGTVSVVGTDDGPVNTVPGPLATSEDAVNVVVNGIQIGDPDTVTADPYTVHLQVVHGTLAIATGGFVTTVVVAGNNGTNGITLRGPMSEINAALAGGGLTYTPDPNYNIADTLTVSSFDGVAADATTFATSVEYATSLTGGTNTPVNIVTGYVNGDAFLDLVYSNNQDANGRVGVRLGNGDGTFGAETTLTAGNGVTDVQLGDFNGDTFLDIAVANYHVGSSSLGTIGIFLGNGAGGFGAMSNVGGAGILGRVFDLSLGDIDRDGDVDIAGARRDFGLVQPVINNGDATFAFASSVDFRPGFSTNGPATTAVNLVDVNNDGDLDMVAVNQTDNSNTPGQIRVALGTAGLNFAAPTVVYQSPAPNENPFQVTTGDLNGDGNVDIVWTSFVPNGAEAIRVMLGNGDGTFGAATPYAVNFDPFSVFIGDVNGDGRPDIVTPLNRTAGTNDVVAVLRGNGNGTFQAAETFNVPIDSTPDAIAIGDFDGDGDNDLATSNSSTGNLSVLLNSTANLGDVDTVAITVAAVNDAPVVVGGATQALTAINEDTPSAGGQTINALLASHYSDAADNQAIWGGSSPGAFSGIAVVSSGTSASGEWQYFDGAVWQDIGAASPAAAKLFPTGTALRFEPALNFNGAAPNLTVHLIDNSLGFGITNALVQDISALGATGGTTAYSGTTIALTQSVTAVNDAPVLDPGASPVLATIDEDPGAPVGAVGTLVSSLVDLNPPAGGLDNVTDVDNVVTGIAVTDVFVGTLYYSLDNGANWTLAPALTAASALLLPADANARVFWLPPANFNGAYGGALNIKAWDQTSGTAGATADTTTGNTAFSAATDSVSIDVNPVNDTPVVPDSPTVTVDEQLTVVLNPTLTISDVDLAARNGGNGDYGGSVFTVSRAVANPEDVFGFSLAGASFAVNGNNLETAPGGLVFGTVFGAGGVFTINFTSSGTPATTALVNDVLRRISYGNSSDTPPASVVLTYTLDDGAPDAVQGTVGGAATDSGTVTVNITAVNDAPINAVPGAQSVDEDDTITLSTGNGNAIQISDVDDGGAAMRVTLTVSNGTLSMVNGAGITVTGDGTDTVILDGTEAALNTALGAGVTYAPTANYNGPDSIGVLTSDLGATGTPGAQTDSDSIAITVNSVNDAPVGTDNEVSGSEDDPLPFAIADFGFDDPNDNPENGFLTVTIESLPVEGDLFYDPDGIGVGVGPSLVVAGNSFTAAQLTTGVLYFQPDPDEYSVPIGSVYASFTFRVRDDGGTALGGDDLADAVNTMDIVIDPDNIPPVANDDLYEAWEDELLSVPLPGVLTNDVDDGLLQPMQAELVSGPLHASSFTLNPDGSFTYTTTNDYSGEDSFVYRVWDGQFYSNDATVELKVFETNDAPLGIDTNVAGSEDSTYVFALGNFAYADEESHPLASVRIDTLPALGSLRLNGVAVTAGQVIAAADITAGLLTFVPPADANGSPYTTFTFTVRDTGGTAHGGVDTDPAPNTISIYLAPVNDAPAAVADSYDIPEDTLVGVAAPGVLVNDSDIDGNAFTADLVSGPANALSFTFNADGSFSYQANAGFTGPDSFSYRAFDGVAYGNTVTVTLNVTPVDDPSVNQPDLYMVNEDALLSGFNVLANDSDPDGPALAVTEVEGSPANVGTQITLASGALLTLNADGTFVYDPNDKYNSFTSAATGASNTQGADSFTYKADNGNTVTVQINVMGVRSPDDLLIGSAGNDVITDLGVNFNDSFLLQQGGNDTATGLGGNDGFYFGAAMTGLDSVNGGSGTDSVAIQGNYAGLVLGTMTNVEVFVALPGNNTSFGDLGGNFYDYNVTTIDSNVAAGQILTVIGGMLRAGEDLAFNGAAETNGSFRMFAGQGNDSFTGGAGSDGFFFGADGNLTGFDRVNGGGGIDSMALRGNYVGGTAVVFQPLTMTNVEVLVFLSGHTNEFGGFIDLNGFDYDVTLADGNLAADQRLDVIGTSLKANESLRFDGRFETDGSFRILSGAGDDTLFGGFREDTLYGGLGADVMDGGFEADTYLYRFANESTAASLDRIIWGAGDKVDLSQVDADANAAGNQAFTFIGTAAFTGVAGQLRYTMPGPNAQVEGDVNGDGIADLVIQIDAHVPVAGDFIL